MDRPLKVATATTFASLVGAAILVALRDIPAGVVSLGATGGVQMTLSVPLFIATLVLLSLGLGYVTAAAMFAATPVALGAILLITGVVAWKTGLLGIAGLVAVMPAWAMALEWVLIATVWAMTLIVRARPSDIARSDRRRLAVIAASCAVFGAYFVVLAAASTRLYGLWIFPMSVHSLMVDVALLSIPLLQIAAVDFGEWGQLLGESSGGAVTGIRRAPWRALVVPIVLCVALVGVGATQLSGTIPARLRLVGEGIVLLAIVLAVLLAAGHAARVSHITWPHSIGFAALFAVLAVSGWGGTVVAGALSGALTPAPTPVVSSAGDYTAAANVHSYTGVSGFSVLVQDGWITQREKTSDTIRSFFPAGTRTFLFIENRVEQGVTASTIASRLGLTPARAPEWDQQWQRLDVTPKDGGAQTIWVTMPTPGQDSLFFVGQATGSDPGPRMRELEAIVRSFRPPGTAAATLRDVVPADSEGVGDGSAVSQAAAAQRHDDVVQSLGVGFDVAVSIVAFALLLSVGRRWPTGVRMAILFYGVIAAFATAEFESVVVRLTTGVTSGWPGLGQARLMIGIGILGLVALAAAARSTAIWARRLPGALAALAGATLVLFLMDLLYTGALSASRTAAWAAIIILVAIGWDITMSGETLTNGSSRLFPRHTRTLVFFGYAILLAGTIVYFSGQHTAISPTSPLAESFFEPESYTQAALFQIALPAMVLLFLLQLFGARAPQDARDSSVSRIPA